jgi:hypothetical protein
LGDIRDIPELEVISKGGSALFPFISRREFVMNMVHYPPKKHIQRVEKVDLIIVRLLMVIMMHKVI